MRTKSFFILLTLIFLPAISSNAYDTYNVHPTINENALLQSFTESYLKNQLGFSKGIEEFFIGDGIKKTVKEWIKEGGRQEDIPFYRANNHFHDPLKPWGSAGLSGNNLGISSVIWAQNQNPLGYAAGGDWSWTKARNSYYEGLTAREKNTREQELAKTFRALGQAMHLLADSSVPAHVRNDIHVFPLEAFGKEWNTRWQTYESWAKKQPPGVLNYAAKEVDQTIFKYAIPNSSASIPISALWDQDVYKGTNPEDTWTTDPIISWVGLAEYTNANYLSEDTIFSDYPHPRKENTTAKLVEQYARDGQLDKTWYVMGYQTERLAAYSYFWDNSGLIPETKWLYQLDNFVYKSYADNLLPRAVGYSAGLINYFFRGDIRLTFETGASPGYVIVNNTDEAMSGKFEIYYDDISDQRHRLAQYPLTLSAKQNTTTFPLNIAADAKEPGKYILVFKGKMGNEDGAVAGYVTSRLLEITPPENYVYSQADPGEDQFTCIDVRLKNASLTEAMTGGSLQAIVRYKKPGQNVFAYAGSDIKTGQSLDAKNQLEVSFDLSNNPIPLDATDVYLQVVYKGNIGTETSGVAVGEKDISEPTPVDFFNNMDRTCIKGAWYVAGSQEAIDAIDSNKDGIPEWDIYPHAIEDAYLKLSPRNAPQEATPSNYTFHINSLEPGGFFRGYILSEYDLSLGSHVTKVTRNAGDNWGHVIRQGVVSGAALREQQEIHGDQAYCQGEKLKAPCVVTIIPRFYPFRGIQMWGSAGIIFDNPEYPSGKKCSWEDVW